MHCSCFVVRGGSCGESTSVPLALWCGLVKTWKPEKLQVQSVGEADCEYKAIYPRKKFSMNLTTLTSKFSAIN